MKWVYRETTPCWVTWTRTIEADNEAEAVQIANEGGGELSGEPEIGDILDGHDLEQDLRAVP